MKLTYNQRFRKNLERRLLRWQNYIRIRKDGEAIYEYSNLKQSAREAIKKDLEEYWNRPFQSSNQTIIDLKLIYKLRKE